MGLARKVSCLCSVACLMLAALLSISRSSHAENFPQPLRDSGGNLLPFTGAQLPSALVPNQFGGQTMEILQTDERATLNWQSFDIRGANNEVRFLQPQSSSIALNRVMGESSSVIDGRLTANGQIYIINQNGLLFTPNAQVNVHSLIASTLDIEQQVFDGAGIVNTLQAAENDNVALQTPSFQHLGEDAAGSLIVEAGAVIQSAQGGRVMLVAPEVFNGGTIETPQGQTILAAAQDKVYLAASTDEDLRGLLVEVNLGGTATNSGTLFADQGNVTMVGLAVNQQGVARATTSSTLNGSVYLHARDTVSSFQLKSGSKIPLADNLGEVTLGLNSLTEVVTTEVEELVSDSLAQPLSQVQMSGKDILMESGSRIYAPGGEVSISTKPNDLVTTKAVEDATVWIQSGASIDVSGDDSTVVPVSRNVVEVRARAIQLADSPLQRDGILRNQLLAIDVRQGTSVIDDDNLQQLVNRSVNERLSLGGSIEIDASLGKLTIDAGAQLDISGGQVTYTASRLNTTRLITIGGQLLDISEARPDMVFSSLLGEFEVAYEKWGVTETFNPFPQFYRVEPGYIEGKDAGQLAIQAREMKFDGDLVAFSISGKWQRQLPDFNWQDSLNRPYQQRALGGTLAIELTQKSLQSLYIDSHTQQQLEESIGIDPTPIVLSSSLLTNSGVAHLSLENKGAIVFEQSLDFLPGAHLEVVGTQVEVAADLNLPSGQIDLFAENFDDGNYPLDEVWIKVDEDAVLNTAGHWSNDYLNPKGVDADTPIAIDGGGVHLESQASLYLAEGSLLDVSAGAHFTYERDLQLGNGGQIVLKNDQLFDNGVSTALKLGAELRGFGFEHGATLQIETQAIDIVTPPGSVAPTDATLLGSRQFSQIEAVATDTSATTATGKRLLVAADTFSKGGFENITLVANDNGLSIAENSRIRLTQSNFFLPPKSEILDQLDGAALAGEVSILRLPDERIAPVALTLVSQFGLDTSNPDFYMGAGASIEGDLGAHLSFSSEGSMFIEGAIDMPAGQIDLKLASDSQRKYDSAKMLWLSSTANLSANGASRLPEVDPLSLRQGEVLDAGQIRLEAIEGSIVAESGSRISVDAVAETIGIKQNNGVVLPELVASQAGSVELIAAETLIYEGQLSGQAAAIDMLGGQFEFSLDPQRRRIEVVRFLTELTPDSYPRGAREVVFDNYNGVMPEAGVEIDPELNGKAYLPVTQLAQGGFDTLKVTVRPSTEGRSDAISTIDSLALMSFPEDLNLQLAGTIQLDTPLLRTTDATVQLSAPVVSLGSQMKVTKLTNAVPKLTKNNETLQLASSSGAGQVRVAADYLELVGELVTQGFGDSENNLPGMSLVVDNDVRLRGTAASVAGGSLNSLQGSLDTAGLLSIQAAQIYPTTLSEYHIQVLGEESEVNFSASGSLASQPLSIGGQLTVQAGEITSSTRLRAPLGSINLEADKSLSLLSGSETSTSALGVRAPFGEIQAGGDLVYSFAFEQVGNNNPILFVEDVRNANFERSFPAQKLTLAAPDISVEEGAEFNLLGGGQALATEFQAGPEGSRDILLAHLDFEDWQEANESFAIVPGISGMAPFDPMLSPAAESVQGISLGDTFYLEKSLPGLDAGAYAVLPARYALFGGYLVTPEPGTQDLSTERAFSIRGGLPLVAGRIGSYGGFKPRRRQGFVVLDADAVAARGNFIQTELSEFIDETLVRTPKDGGALTIAASNSLQLAGALRTSDTLLGRGSEVDLLGEKITIVANGSNVDVGGIVLTDANLSGLGADSLLVGGHRQLTEEGTALQITAESVRLEPGVKLSLPELLLVATEVEVDASATLKTEIRSTSPPSSTKEEQLTLLQPGALLAVSNRDISFVSDGQLGTTDVALSVADNVQLETSGGTLLLESAGDADIQATLAANGGVLRMGAPLIFLGVVNDLGSVQGLRLDREILSELQGSRLSLRSDNPISVRGALGDSSTNQPLQFAQLEFNAPGLQGNNNADQIALLAADEIQFSNLSSIPLTTHSEKAEVNSKLKLQANQFVQEDGDFYLSGFEAVDLDATRGWHFDGESQLLADGKLNVKTPLITAAAGSQAQVRAQQSLTVATPSTSGPLSEFKSGLGANLIFTGSEVDFASRVQLPSGHFNLRQLAGTQVQPTNPTLTLRTGAEINVAGQSFSFSDLTVSSPGGEISLSTETGSVLIEDNVILNASSGGVDSSAGSIQIEASSGDLKLSPLAKIEAKDSQASSGRFSLNADRLTSIDGSVTDAMSLLHPLLVNGGFQRRQAIRLRQQDILVAADQQLSAEQFYLVSDTGSIRVAGTLNAHSERGGLVELAAGDELELLSGAKIFAGASGANADGGRVDLIALDSDEDDVNGSRDRVDLRAGSEIDVSGGAGGRGGQVFVHTRQQDLDQDGIIDAVLIGDLSAQSTGARITDLVATNNIRDAGFDPNAEVSRLTSHELTQWQVALAGFVNDVETGTIDTSNLANWRLIPGLNVESSGDLVLQDNWDFYNGWHFGTQNNLPGVLTLRAAGDIDFTANLSDAFFEDLIIVNFNLDSSYFNRLPEEMTKIDRLATGESWRYRISAGADLASSSITSLGSTGSLYLQEDSLIRTGTADIDLMVAKDISLASGSEIYTAGENPGISAQMIEETQADVQAIIDQIAPLQAYSVPLDVPTVEQWLDGMLHELLGRAQFAENGGNVRIQVGNNLVAQNLQRLPTIWQRRIGLPEANPNFGAAPTHIAIAFDHFDDAIGALGGGSVQIEVGGTLKDIAIAIPTNTRAISGVEVESQEFFGFKESPDPQLVTAGGGALDLRVGRDIAGGYLYLGDSNANILVQEQTLVGSNGVAPILYLSGDSSVNWLSNGDLQTGGVVEPYVIQQSQAQLNYLRKTRAQVTNLTPIVTNFLNYSPTAKLSLKSLSGSVTLSEAQGEFEDIDNTTVSDIAASRLLAPSLTAISFEEDVLLASSLSLFPSAVGQFELLAKGDIRSTKANEIFIRQSDVEPTLYPSLYLPVGEKSIRQYEIEVLTRHAERPVHETDKQPNRVVSLEGNIGSKDGDESGVILFDFAKASMFRAAEDIANVTLKIQNIQDSDFTLISAGEDIFYSTLRSSTGVFSSTDFRGIDIAGPGAALVSAGRQISLGTSLGIKTIGNLENISLAETGASLTLLAGIGDAGVAVDEYALHYPGTFLAYLGEGSLSQFDSLLNEMNAPDFSQLLANDVAFAQDRALRLDELPADMAKTLSDEVRQLSSDANDPVFRTEEVAFTALPEALQLRVQHAARFLALSTAKRKQILAELNFPANAQLQTWVVQDFFRELLETGALASTDREDLTDNFVAGYEAIDLLFPSPNREGGISLILSQIQTGAGGDINMLVPGGGINAGAADSGVIAKETSELGITARRSGDVNIFVDQDLLVNSTRVFSEKDDLLIWSSNGNIDAGRGASTVASLPPPVTRLDPESGLLITEFPPAVTGSGLKAGGNAFLFTPRGLVNAFDADLTVGSDLTIAANQVLGADTIQVGGTAVGVPTAPASVAVGLTNVANETTGAASMAEDASLGGDDLAEEGGLDEVALGMLMVEILAFGEEVENTCVPGEECPAE